jgi:hypothetical protein
VVSRISGGGGGGGGGATSVRHDVMALWLAAAPLGNDVCGNTSLTAGNLRGVHLRITMVQEPRYTEMTNHSSGELLHPSRWSGMTVEILRWIAEQAGFTYTLLSASGNGSECEPPNGVGTRSNYSQQYNCAQGDVTELGISDVYMGTFFVTPDRLEAGLMTKAWDSDSGLAVCQAHFAVETLEEYVELHGRGSENERKVCTQFNSAYSDMLERVYPRLIQHRINRKDYMDALHSGECAAHVDPLPIGHIIAARRCAASATHGARARRRPHPARTHLDVRVCAR